MTINNFAFTPSDGLRNAVSFPTDPATEADARNQPQTLLDQLRDYINNTIITEVNNKLALSGGSLTGALSSNNTLTGTALIASGLTGATQASRYVGATTSGPPSSGTFNKGDWVLSQDGYIWQCTVAGTPGTWVKSGGTSAVAVASTYTGDGTSSRTINIGFTPKFVMIQSAGNWAQHFTGAIPHYYNIQTTDNGGGISMSDNRSSSAFNGITTNGFIVGIGGGNFNANGTSYPYIAIG